MSQYDLASIIISSIALAISIIPIIVNIVKFFKNRLSTKTLQVELSKLSNDGGWNTDWLHGDLTITNNTKKEFTISRIIVIVNGQYCKVWQPREKLVLKEFNVPITTIPPIRLLSHDAAIIDFFIEASFRIEKPTVAVLSLVTPYQRLDYPITLPIDGGKNDCNDE